MIYTIAEIKALIPSLATKSDPIVSALLDQAEVEILALLKKKTLPVVDPLATPLVYPAGIKTACRLLIEGYVASEKRGSMSEFRQWSIQVKYDDSDKVADDRYKDIKRALSQFYTVQIWS